MMIGWLMAFAPTESSKSPNGIEQQRGRDEEEMDGMKRRDGMSQGVRPPINIQMTWPNVKECTLKHSLQFPSQNQSKTSNWISQMGMMENFASASK
jgi:hypothetical protein